MKALVLLLYRFDVNRKNNSMRFRVRGVLFFVGLVGVCQVSNIQLRN